MNHSLATYPGHLASQEARRRLNYQKSFLPTRLSRNYLDSAPAIELTQVRESDSDVKKRRRKRKKREIYPSTPDAGEEGENKAF
jgi:hypothetical protein